MNNLQGQIQQEHERLQRAEQAQLERQRAAQQAHADAKTIAESSQRLRQLRIQEAEQQFTEGIRGSNAALIAEHNANIGKLYAALDAYDLKAALGLFGKAEKSFNTQQQHKHQLVGLLRDEANALMDEARAAQLASIPPGTTFETDRQQYINENAIMQAGSLAYTRRVGQVPNAIGAHPALAQYVSTKKRGSQERRIAAGLCFALCGIVFDPQDGYSAQADTDTQLRNQMGAGAR